MTAHTSLPASIELLESRIAPAVMILNATTATYTDVDGDRVTIKVSTGTLTGGLFTTTGLGLGEQLQTINFSAGGFDAANLTISVVRGDAGDGLAQVGFINSAGHDLGKVSVQGDLGRINAGDGDAAMPAVKSLTVRSMGRFGIATQEAGGTFGSSIAGVLGALVVKGDFKEIFMNVNGGIGPVTIAGSLIGGAASGSGYIFCTGDIGAVKIGGDMLGGAGADSGFITASGKIASVTIGGSLVAGTSSSAKIISSGDLGPVKIGRDVRGGAIGPSGFIASGGTLASVTIGGSLIGGAGASTGRISTPSTDIGPVKIGHDMVGGAGSDSGLIFSGGELASVTIGGSLVGGAGTGSGKIFSGKEMGKVKIGHDFIGGSITGSTATLDQSGYITSFERIAGVTIGGSIISGIDDSTGGDLTRNASIRAGDDLGSLVVKGSVVGHLTANGASRVIISGQGQAVQGATSDLAIGKISIAGHVEFARIFAGYDADLVARNGDAQIGAVKVGGDWAASSLVAGVLNGTSGNTNFGNANDQSIGAGNTNITSRIASILIGGHVIGTQDSISIFDQFGFVAGQIGSFKAEGFKAPLTSGNDGRIFLSPITAAIKQVGTAPSDVAIHEV